MRSYYITTPIYYVNGAPHLGHAYTSIAADVLARWKRLDGYQVFFLTGTDEHGQKVEKAAADAGVSPQAFADRVAGQFEAMGKVLAISNDDFIRTTQPRHIAACQAFWRRLADAGAIYQGHYEGYYAVRDEAFYGPDELTTAPDGRKFATETKSPVEWMREPSWFFRLSAYQSQLLALHEENPALIAPGARRNELLNFLRGGLSDLSISRSSFRWGVPVPGDHGHVMYVWFDALINYLTAIGYPDTTAERAGFWPADLHLVGKEISRFHALYWPAFLMAAGLAMPRRIFSHGWWTVDGEKMSKSLGNGLDPAALVAMHGLDPLRYYLLREIPFGGDGDFRSLGIAARRDRELANDLGNLAQRSLSLVARHCAGLRPPFAAAHKADAALLAASAALPDQLRALLDRQAFSEALERVWAVVRAANAYIDQQAPWALKRTDEPRMAAVLRVLLDVMHIVAVVLTPFMPGSMTMLLDQLGVAEEARNLAGMLMPLPAGGRLPPPAPIFPRSRTEIAL